MHRDRLRIFCKKMLHNSTAIRMLFRVFVMLFCGVTGLFCVCVIRIITFLRLFSDLKQAFHTASVHAAIVAARPKSTLN